VNEFERLAARAAGRGRLEQEEPASHIRRTAAFACECSDA
jgi:hypothetical protein